MIILKKNIKEIGGNAFKYLMTSLNLNKGAKIILVYHRIVKELPVELHDPAMFVTLSTLEMHLRELSALFRIVPIDSLFEDKRDNQRLCSITLDDGWKDNYDYGFPLFKKYNIPATIFIPLDIIGTKSKLWFQSLWEIASIANDENKKSEFISYFKDVVPECGLVRIDAKHIYDLTEHLKKYSPRRLEEIINGAYSSIGISNEPSTEYLSWNQIEEMSKYGITFGSHGLSHNILTQIGREDRIKEIIGSREKLIKANIAISSVFSYPSGYYDEETATLVEKAGYKYAVTIRPGFNTRKTHPFCLNRIMLHENISNSSALLWGRLLQTYAKQRA